MYGGFPGMGFGQVGAGFAGSWWGIGAVVVGTLILIALCCVLGFGI
ncbi:MAG TPA: hypothetical protein VHQ46_06875 [Desulfobacteria bacterium]|nr:hypothetical protein [Desulfobacteria bacterium]